MSRPLRLEFAGAIWHVTSRGNEQREVFRDDADRERFLEVLARTVDLCRWQLHAFALVGNHYHLLVETPETTLSRGMRQLNGVYTQHFNRRHGRVGHLFQGRFKAILVERESHLLELARYVVLNPVRAGLVASPEDWSWSSYRATAGLEPAPGWLATSWTLSQFGRRRLEASRRYRTFVAEGARAGYDPWAQLRGQIYLGSDGFLDDVERRAAAGSPGRGVPRGQLQPSSRDPRLLFRRCLAALGRNEEEILRQTRLLAAERKCLAHVLRRHGLLGNREIGDLLGVGEAQASLLATSGEGELVRRADLRKRLQAAVERPAEK